MSAFCSSHTQKVGDDFIPFGETFCTDWWFMAVIRFKTTPMPKLSVHDSISTRATRLACSLLLVFLWHSGPGAQADVIDDCSDTSLRAAAGNGGSYFFDCGTNPTTIALTNTIVVTADVTFDGAGQSIVISGGNAVRLFTINPGVNFTLKNLVLASGKAA
ncbi:MAG: hypothetical protein DME23_03905, partial [Verrucomicrobia bacterium]